MKIWKWTWVIGALLMAAPAYAGYFVNGTTGSNSNDGSYALPFADFGPFNAIAQPGDTCYAAAYGPGYATFPNPNRSGTSSSHIVILGDTTNMNKVPVAGTDGEVPMSDYVERLGFRYLGSVSEYYPNPCNFCIWAKSRMWGGGMLIRGNNELLRSLTVGSLNADSTTRCTFALNPVVSTQGDNVTIQDCAFFLRNGAAGTDNATTFRIEPEDKSSRIDNFRLYRTRIVIENRDGNTPVTTDYKNTMFNRLKNSHLVSTSIIVQDSSGYDPAGGLTRQGILFRDGLDSVFVFNCLLKVITERAGLGPVSINLCGSGNSLTGTGPNTFRLDTLINYTPSVSSIYYQWQIQNGDSLTHCAVVCSTGVNNSGFLITATSGNSHIWRNTIINKTGTGGAIVLGPNVGQYGSIDLRNNAYITYSTSTNADMVAAYYNTSYPQQVVSDYNDFAHLATGRAMKMRDGSFNGIGSGTAPCSYGWDCNSIQRATCLTDSVGDNWNYAPIGHVGNTTNWLVSAGYGGTTIGRQDTTSATADATAPAAISDLTASTGPPGAITLMWTAPGDDNSSGTATSYDLRVSTSLITAGNFSSATPWPAPSPAVAGTIQTYNVLGLPGNTVYYAALKTRDEVGNTSTISNVVYALTGRAGGGGGGEVPE